MPWRVLRNEIDDGLSRLSSGERIAVVSAIFLFVLMFFHWFGVEAVNTSNLLFAIQSVAPGKNAWEALDYIPTVLLITILATLAVAALRLTNALRRDSVPVNAVIAILGLASVLLIGFRIVDPPVFYVEPTITFEGAVQFPIFLALLAAAGIAYCGFRAMREEGVSFARLARMVKCFWGKASGVIRFAVRCVAPSRGARVGFSLARYSLTTMRSKPRIRHLEHYPAIRGPGAVTKAGECRWVSAVVDCEAQARGRIMISGEFEVNPATECALGVSIVVEESPRCTGHVCPASLNIKTLRMGLPTGC